MSHPDEKKFQRALEKAKKRRGELDKTKREFEQGGDILVNCQSGLQT